MLHRAWTIGLCLWLMAGADCGAQSLASDQRSFAAEQDIRKMQAVMMARMQAQGYQPAMAMANPMGR